MGIDPMNNISNNNKNTLCIYIILTIVEVETLVLNPPLLTFLMIPLDSSLQVTRIRTPLHDSLFKLHTNLGSQPTIDSKWKKD
jgi:hypothetical protein